jgi:hypothetical protein
LAQILQKTFKLRFRQDRRRSAADVQRVHLGVSQAFSDDIHFLSQGAEVMVDVAVAVRDDARFIRTKGAAHFAKRNMNVQVDAADIRQVGQDRVRRYRA